jgi:lipopolysaccharide transport system ATP-binding protein
MGVVQTLCKRGIVLKKGTVTLDDTAQEAVSAYLSNLEAAVSHDLAKRQDRKGKGEVKLQRIEAYTADDYQSSTLATGRPVRFVFSLDRSLPGVSCIFTLYDQYGNAVVNFNSSIHSHVDQVDNGLDRQIVCECDALTLMPGRYRMNAALFKSKELQDHLEAVAVIDVKDGELQGRPVLSGIQPGSLAIPHCWLLPA